MLTAAGCQARRARLWDRLAEKPDWILIADPQYLTYLANYYPSPFEFRSANARALLILGADGSSRLVVDNLLDTFAAEAHVDEVVTGVWYQGQASAPNRQELFVSTVVEHLARCPGRHFGIDTAHVPAGVLDALWRERKPLAIAPIESTLHDMKRSKDPDELAVIQRSMDAGSHAHREALAKVRPGMTELEVFLLVQQAAATHAGLPVQVYGDFVSGPRCEKIGGPPSDRVIERGDLVLVDFSVVVRGYRGDFANTFVCGEKPSDALRRMYDACLDAIAAGEQLVRAGCECRRIDQAIRASFDTRQLARHFTSHSGHGIGLGHPDPPYLVPQSHESLLAGDVIAIEPGLYVAGTGGMRYEHNYRVTESGFERLSSHELAIEQPTE